MKLEQWEGQTSRAAETVKLTGLEEYMEVTETDLYADKNKFNQAVIGRLKNIPTEFLVEKIRDNLVLMKEKAEPEIIGRIENFEKYLEMVDASKSTDRGESQDEGINGSLILKHELLRLFRNIQKFNQTI